MRFELVVDGEEAAVLSVLGAIFPGQTIADIDTIRNGVSQLLEKVDQIAMTAEERAAAFEQRLNTIDLNTSLSAGAADVIKDGIAAIRTELDTVLTEAGVPAATEDSILGRLDTMAGTTGQLKTFLEATAAGFSRPSPTPEPPAVPVPVLAPPASDAATT